MFPLMQYSFEFLWLHYLNRVTCYANDIELLSLGVLIWVKQCGEFGIICSQCTWDCFHTCCIHKCLCTFKNCQGTSKTGNVLCPSTHRAPMYLWNGHSRG